MLRVKLLKDSKHGRVGDIIVMDNNEAFGLIDGGIAILTKDMIPDDYKSKALDEEQANGRDNLPKVQKNI